MFRNIFFRFCILRNNQFQKAVYIKGFWSADTQTRMGISQIAQKPPASCFCDSPAVQDRWSELFGENALLGTSQRRTPSDAPAANHIKRLKRDSERSLFSFFVEMDDVESDTWNRHL